LITEDQVREHLNKIDTHKPMGPDKMYPKVLRELVNVIARPLSIIFKREKMVTGEVPKDWKKLNITPAFTNSKGATS